ncbi:MAG: hypothetical protein GXO74_10970 [Calditrichaeota bacterium]|nr:hypothetical protein [Calditrichota bacterium]
MEVEKISPRKDTEPRRKKTIILGLDGGTWTVFDRLMAKGKMKNLQRILSAGVHGDLKSTVPPVTGPAWVSFATGKNPGKHGCFDFTFPDASLSRLRTISTERIEGKTFYEYLVENGKKIVLVNLPVSYPPRTEGVTVTSLLTKGEQCVFPENLREEIPLLKKYRITPDMNLLAQKKLREYFEDIRAVEKIRFQSAQQLFQRDWDFFFLLFSGVDWLQHVALDALLAEKSDESSPLLKYFDDVDEYLAWFFDSLDESTNLIIISDHGFQVFQGTFFVNEWLQQRGYLTLKNQTNGEADAHQVVADLNDAYEKKWKQIFVPFWMRKIILSNRFFNKIGIKFYQMLRDKLSLQVRVEVAPDFSNTRAFCTSGESSGIYLNRKNRFTDGAVDDADYLALRARIIFELKELKDDSGERIFDYALPKEAIYHGDKADEAPDIIFKSRRYWSSSSFSARVLEQKEFFSHHPSGVFAAAGPDFRQGGVVDGAEIIDIAPTVLYLMDLLLPDDMDGKVLTSALSPEVLKEKPVRRMKGEQKGNVMQKSTDESDDLVRQRLRGLGYME